MISAELLDEVVKRLSRFQPQRIILFGSQARGTADSCSDVDILVLGEFADDRAEVVLAMDRSLRGLKLARDVVVMTPEEFERDRDIPGTIARPAEFPGSLVSITMDYCSSAKHAIWTHDAPSSCVEWKSATATRQAIYSTTCGCTHRSFQFTQIIGFNIDFGRRVKKTLHDFPKRNSSRHMYGGWAKCRH